MLPIHAPSTCVSLSGSFLRSQISRHFLSTDQDQLDQSRDSVGRGSLAGMLAHCLLTRHLSI